MDEINPNLNNDRFHFVFSSLFAVFLPVSVIIFPLIMFPFDILFFPFSILHELGHFCLTLFFLPSLNPHIELIFGECACVP